MIDRKGIAAFLIITFTLTYAIEGALIWSGFRITDQPALYGQLAIVGVMWAPAFATVLTIKFITREGFAGTNLRFGSWRPYLKTALVIPAVFVLIYALTWLLGLGNPDWQLTDLSEMAATAGADISQMPQPLAIILGTLAITLVVTPFINSLVAFGEELGWRGYLLPKLMPLGKTKAYLLMGVIWGLWHAPLVLIGFNYPGYPILGVLWMISHKMGVGSRCLRQYLENILAFYEGREYWNKVDWDIMFGHCPFPVYAMNETTAKEQAEEYEPG